MTRPAHARRFLPRCLELEPRDVPAGNITVTQLGTELRVIGDAAANTFTIRGHGPGVVEIQGTNTTINGGNAKVTATGVAWLRVAGRAGDDVITTRDLAVPRVHVFGQDGNDAIDLAGTRGGDVFAGGGAGDDVIRVADTSNGDRFVSINVSGDEWTPDGSLANGSDTITVTGVRAHGEGAYVGFQGDAPSDDRPGGRDRMTLSNVDLDDVGWFEFDVLADYVPTDLGNEVTFENIRATVVNDYVYLPSYMEGGPGDDTFRFRNIDVDVHGGFDATLEWYVGASWAGGNDTIDVTDTRIASHTDPVEGGFNQTGLGLDADTVRVNNFEFVGGGIFSGGFFGGTYYTGAWVSIVADDVDLRNIAFHTNGFGGIGAETQESWVDGVPRDGTYSLTNVSITSADGSSGGFYLGAGGGDDRVDVRNSSFETLGVTAGEGDDSISVNNSDLGIYVNIDLGDGNDSLTFVNVAFNAHYVFPNGFETGGINAGGGDDTVSLTNCDCEALVLDMGDGDDTVNMTNCVFVTADLFGGDGTDTLTLTNNTGLFTIDGFEL